MTDRELADIVTDKWQEIGYDALQCCVECGEEPIMKREDAFSMCMDYLDNKDYEHFKDMSKEQRKKIMERAFPYELCGL